MGVSQEVVEEARLVRSAVAPMVERRRRGREVPLALLWPFWLDVVVDKVLRGRRAAALT